MAEAVNFVTLRHGTTRKRAESIVANGPDGNFREPGEVIRVEGEFWTADARVPVEQLYLGNPAIIALGKARLFPLEGGPAILEIEVPNWLIELIAMDRCGNISRMSGGICFNNQCGLPELIRAWPSLVKRIIEVKSWPL